MKKKLFNSLRQNFVALTAVCAFVIMGSLNVPDERTAPEDGIAADCGTGYGIQMNNLRKFMLDSLAGIQFEGGKYNKIDLLTAISNLSGDSVFLLNVLRNCQLSQGTDLAITSRFTNNVSFVNAKCRPCPGRACCPKKVCITRVKLQKNNKVTQGKNKNEQKSKKNEQW